MKTFVVNALKNWKSSVGGLLTVTLATTAAVIPITKDQKMLLILGGIQAVGKAWISLLEKDAK